MFCKTNEIIYIDYLRAMQAVRFSVSVYAESLQSFLSGEIDDWIFPSVLFQVLPQCRHRDKRVLIILFASFLCCTADTQIHSDDSIVYVIVPFSERKGFYGVVEMLEVCLSVHPFHPIRKQLRCLLRFIYPVVHKALVHE
jgi:hypothetical protein